MKTLKYAIYILLTFIIGYLLSIVIFPRITVKPEHIQNLRTINIYLKSNGVHTDLVVPIKNKYYNWSKHFHQSQILTSSVDYTHIAIGWGDKGFYLDTPTWADLTIKTATKAALGLSSTAIHITYYKTILENELCVKIAVSPEQYKRLYNYITTSAELTNSNKFIHIPTTANYGTNDAFYEAKGSYHLFKTCNTWVNKALKESGQKACLWTITSKQIINQYKK